MGGIIPKLRSSGVGGDQATQIIQQLIEGDKYNYTSYYGNFPYRLQVPYGSDMYDSSDLTYIKYEHHMALAGTATTMLGATWLAMTFTPTSGHNLNNVRLYLVRENTKSPGTVTVGVRATTAGEPSGADLASGTTDGDTISTTGEWRTITISPELSLDADTTYALVVRVESATDRLFWAYNNNIIYAGGSSYRSTDSGANWTGASHYFNFAEYGTAAPENYAYIWIE